MQKRTHTLWAKKDVDYYVDAIQQEDYVLFENGTAEVILKHKKGSHILFFKSGKQSDLYVIYDSIKTIVTVYDDNGRITPEFVLLMVWEALSFVCHNCRYHAYPDVIAAILNGNDNHYISDYCHSYDKYGVFRDSLVSEEFVETLLKVLVIFSFAKEKSGKHKRNYFYVRKDNRLWNRKPVWYVCYGSNLCKERFMCYITGKANDKYGVEAGEKCKDQSPIMAVKHIKIPYEMYFGNSSGSWENGGVCFIKNTKDPNKWSFATAYLISETQYNHAWKREGKSSNWYGNEIELGPIDGIPAKTFTSNYEHSFNKPCQRYLNVVKDGLIEWGLSNQKAYQYLFCKTNVNNQ